MDTGPRRSHRHFLPDVSLCTTISAHLLLLPRRTACQVLTEDEARRGLEVEGLRQMSDCPVAILKWHFGENLGEALEEIARFYSAQSHY